MQKRRRSRHACPKVFEMGLPEIKPLAPRTAPPTSTVSPSELAKYTISPIRGRIGADTCLILEPNVDERRRDLCRVLRLGSTRLGFTASCEPSLRARVVVNVKRISLMTASPAAIGCQ